MDELKIAGLDAFMIKKPLNDDSFCGDTGLIKGTAGGADISLMRYSIGLMIKSGPENVKEFFEHMRRQRGESIRPDEQITDEDIKRLFG